MSFQARHRGTCVGCGADFPAGTRLKRTRLGYAHAICPARKVAVRPGPTAPPPSSRPGVAVAGRHGDCPLCGEAVLPHSQVVKLAEGDAHWRCVVT